MIGHPQQHFEVISYKLKTLPTVFLSFIKTILLEKFNIMEQKYPIGSRGYYALVSEFQGYAMVHIRKFYEGNPTKFGIALSKREWSILMNRAKKLDNLIKQMQKALEARKDSEDKEQFESESFHIGFRGFYAMVTEFQHSLFVHVRPHLNQSTNFGRLGTGAAYMCSLAHS